MAPKPIVVIAAVVIIQLLGLHVDLVQDFYRANDELRAQSTFFLHLFCRNTASLLSLLTGAAAKARSSRKRARIAFAIDELQTATKRLKSQYWKRPNNTWW